MLGNCSFPWQTMKRERVAGIGAGGTDGEENGGLRKKECTPAAMDQG